MIRPKGDNSGGASAEFYEHIVDETADVYNLERLVSSQACYAAASCLLSCMLVIARRN